MSEIPTDPDFPGDRGFAHWEPTTTEYGCLVRLYESSAAVGPRLWLTLTLPPEETPGNLEASETHTHAHLTVEQAIEIVIKLVAAIRYVSGETIKVGAGEMHPVDKAFYDLTVKERNKAWRDLNAAEARIKELEER